MCSLLHLECRQMCRYAHLTSPSTWEQHTTKNSKMFIIRLPHPVVIDAPDDIKRWNRLSALHLLQMGQSSRCLLLRLWIQLRGNHVSCLVILGNLGKVPDSPHIQNVSENQANSSRNKEQPGRSGNNRICRVSSTLFYPGALVNTLKMRCQVKPNQEPNV